MAKIANQRFDRGVPQLFFPKESKEESETLPGSEPLVSMANRRTADGRPDPIAGGFFDALIQILQEAWK